jgi:PAS domain S-box-containing protein
MTARLDVPRAARLYVYAVGVAGIGCVAVRAPDFARWRWRDLAAMVALAAATAALEQIRLNIRYRTENQSFSLTDGVWTAGLLLARPSILSVAVVAGLLAGQKLHSVHPFKILFNAGQSVVGITAAELVFSAVRPAGGGHIATWLAVALAMAAYLTVNSLAMARVISLVEGKRFRDVMRQSLGFSVVNTGGNVAVGLLGALIWTMYRPALPLLLVPIGLSYVGYRTWLFDSMENRTRLADVLANTSDGIFVLSTEQRVQSWNPAMERITGMGRDDVLGQSWAEVFGSDGPIQGTEAEAGESDIVFRRADGSERWIRYMRTYILDRRGSTTASVVVARDVTAELEAERLKSDFVAMVTHDLRGPLTPLKGFASALAQGMLEDTPEARREYYQIMVNQTDRLERILSDLMEVSKIESGTPFTEIVPFDLMTVVVEHVDEFARQYADGRVHLTQAPDELHVQGDPLRVGQVLSNLISNAIKYSPDDSQVQVAVSVDGERALVSVRDEGEGVSAAEQGRVFDRFHRVRSGERSRTGGIGLGLYIARRLVEAMSGRIWLVSSPGRGSTFSFSLPLWRHEVDEEPTPRLSAPRAQEPVG